MVGGDQERAGDQLLRVLEGLGEWRTDWSHEVRSVKALRYSITFRTLRVRPFNPS